MANKSFHIFKASLLAFVLATPDNISAQQFSEYFLDKTLRLNYTFGGNATEEHIFLNNMNSIEGWNGRRHNLGKLPVEGNAQVYVTDKKSGKLIYCNSFSTLFQEWQTYDEAKTSCQSFENVVLIPMPKDTVCVRVDLKDNHRQVKKSLTQTIAPNDILIREIGSRHPQYTVIQRAANPESCINIAFLAEGYTEQEMDYFIEDAHTATEAIFSHEPFKKYRDRFNICAVKSPSTDSGTSEPTRHIWKETAVNSNFDTFHSDRYLTTLNLFKLHDKLAGTPYDHIIILVNTNKYGGGGILNFYNLVMTGDRNFKPVVVHEFGHSFAGLADEYAYPTEELQMYPLDVEPWEANITTLVDFNGKWENLIDKKTPIPTPETDKTGRQRIGLYEGAGYRMKKVYRGEQNCRMRTNSCPVFCTVCQNALEKLIKFYTEE